MIFENELSAKITSFNTKYFPSPQFKYDLQQKHINENKYAIEKKVNF